MGANVRHSALTAWFDQNAPWDAGFISLMRVISATTPSNPQPARAALPAQETFILGQCASMTFAPREISALSWHNDKLKLQLFGLGVWGAQGAMPLHMTEQAYARAELHDTTLTDFLDIFHHRALTQFYRAWHVSQDTASLDRMDDQRFAFYIGSLVGLDPRKLDNTPLPVHARLASSAHLIREARNPEGVLGALHYYFGIPVNIEEFSPQWLLLDKNAQSIFGQEESALLLGDGGILGDMVLDRQHKFRLVLGPLTLEQYMSFSLWGQDLPVLREWVRNFIGYEYAWDVKLVLAADQVPVTRLNGSHQLGYTTWLERYPSEEPLAGMIFAPEMHQG
ncbi:type VI secretion system baseplate subunit TssG [Scandinavium goeteborgense]|uniref:type VI secretion system baseplate subunit TssG n=1 Tax=Scandinavium goeteborgense TaxID=1851514 RepID=UPI00381E848D